MPLRLDLRILLYHYGSKPFRARTICVLLVLVFFFENYHASFILKEKKEGCAGYSS